MSFTKSLWETANPAHMGARLIASDNAVAAFWNKPIRVVQPDGTLTTLDKKTFAPAWLKVRRRHDEEGGPSWVRYLLASLFKHFCCGARFRDIRLEHDEVRAIMDLSVAAKLSDIASIYTRPTGLSDEIVEAEWNKPRLSKRAKLELANYRRRRKA